MKLALLIAIFFGFGFQAQASQSISCYEIESDGTPTLSGVTVYAALFLPSQNHYQLELLGGHVTLNRLQLDEHNSARMAQNISIAHISDKSQQTEIIFDDLSQPNLVYRLRFNKYAVNKDFAREKATLTIGNRAIPLSCYSHTY